MSMGQNQALYLLVNDRSMLSLSLTLGEIYTDHAGPNGFLYITYASQEVFGNEDLRRIESLVCSWLNREEMGKRLYFKC